MAGILVFLKFILFKPYFNTVVVKCKGMTKCYFSWTLIQQILTLLYTIIFSNCSVSHSVTRFSSLYLILVTVVPFETRMIMYGLANNIPRDTGVNEAFSCPDFTLLSVWVCVCFWVCEYERDEESKSKKSKGRRYVAVPRRVTWQQVAKELMTRAGTCFT